MNINKKKIVYKKEDYFVILKWLCVCLISGLFKFIEVLNLISDSIKIGF